MGRHGRGEGSRRVGGLLGGWEAQICRLEGKACKERRNAGGEAGTGDGSWEALWEPGRLGGKEERPKGAK